MLVVHFPLSLEYRCVNWQTWCVTIFPWHSLRSLTLPVWIGEYVKKKLSFDLDSLRSHTLAMSMCVCVWLRFVARARDNKMGEILPTKIGQSTLLSRWSTVCDHHFSVPKSCFGFLSFSHDLSQFCYFWTLNLVNCVLNVCFPFIHWPFWAIPWAEFRQKKNGNWCRRKSDMVRVTLMRCRRSCTCVLFVRVQQA